MRTLRPGPTTLLQVPGLGSEDDTMQVAVGWPSEDPGEPVILVRFGAMAVALSLSGAESLSEGLADAVVEARLEAVDKGGPVQ